ncbi:HotDog domain-containing protein [Amylocarpus encephaloides]|uniref:HotDog domain-containing protein n=1 Tax=Amylocarpus encephaloides TaxID=45428 RepID=A0A9P7YKG0_9HELO|nr:HotDog domain-containing protein [Amylocarpus encephaloides]
MEEADLAHFHSIPWCSALLKDPNIVITPTFSRQPKPNTEDSLLALTLRSPTTIPRCLSFHPKPTPSSPSIASVCTLFTLGPDLNGGPRVLHGGMIATLMDDVMGTLLTIKKDGDAMPLSGVAVTGTLNVRYLRRIPTPGTVLVVARVQEVRGRKYDMAAEVMGGEGEVFARAESLWIRRKGGAEKL